MKRSLDFLTKSSVAKFTSRSKNFAKLANSTNISIVFENEKTLKKCFVRQRSINKSSYQGSARDVLGKHREQY